MPYELALTSPRLRDVERDAGILGNLSVWRSVADLAASYREYCTA